jgi:hypothetical protein
MTFDRPVPLIVQIIPAAGWRWRPEDDDGPARELTCFALVERAWDDDRPPERAIEGVDLECDGLYGLVSEFLAVYVPPERSP